MIKGEKAQVKKGTKRAKQKSPAHVDKPNLKFQPRQPKANDWTNLDHV